MNTIKDASDNNMTVANVLDQFKPTLTQGTMPKDVPTEADGETNTEYTINMNKYQQVKVDLTVKDKELTNATWSIEHTAPGPDSTTVVVNANSDMVYLVDSDNTGDDTLVIPVLNVLLY